MRFKMFTRQQLEYIIQSRSQGATTTLVEKMYDDYLTDDMRNQLASITGDTDIESLTNLMRDGE